jgi:Domain of unknown function (DUF5666)
MNGCVIRAILVGAIAALSGCSGGVGGAGGNAGAGIDRSGVSVGPMSSLGSVFVNGVEWNTDNATIAIDDAPGSETGLRVGDMLRVTGTINANGAATATRVTSDHVVDGPIGAIDATTRRVTVLGQTIVIDGDTVFGDSIVPATFAGLSVAQNIEVHGIRDADGVIHATRIEASAAGASLDVTGSIANLGAVPDTFTIGALTVDYADAALDDFDGKFIANGDVVQVKGDALNGGGTLMANRVQYQGASALAGARPGEEFEVEGFISSVSGTTAFVVAGVTINVTGATRFDGGTASDLAVNVKVEVEGTAGSSGGFIAERVEIKRTAALQVTATLDAAPNLAAKRLTVLGISIGTSATTQFEDKTESVQYFDLADLTAGDYVEVRGVSDSTGGVDMIATRIERDDEESDAELRGPVAATNGSTLVVLGVTIVTTAGTQFRDASEQSISAAEFFGQLDVGDTIETEGIRTGVTQITADALDLQN